MSDTSRKWAGRAFQLALVVIALAYIGNWIRTRFHHTTRDAHMAGLEQAPDSLGAGDLRILNSDSTVELVLAGNRIWAGLSPEMVAKVRHDLDTSQTSDSGLGGSIAKIVKQSVAGAIDTHAVYRVADVRDVRYDSGQIVFDWKSGGHQTIFQNTRVNGERADKGFRREDAQRFIDAFHARQQELGGR
jgi:hypothetical protein